MIDKEKIKKAFSRGATDYDSYANVQSESAVRLVNKALTAYRNPLKVLDIGTGTGNCILSLRETLPVSKIYGFDIAEGMTQAAHKKSKSYKDIYIARADADNIPFKPNSFDLIVSNLTYQWVERLDRAFFETMRVLHSGGYFAFTLLGTDTFCELKASYNSIDFRKNRLPPLHTFIDKDNIINQINSAGFLCRYFDRHIIKKRYTDVLTFLKTLKKIGAQNASPYMTAGGLNRGGTMKFLIDYYEKNFSDDSKIYATYDILMITCQKP